jgi:hypothetical protein
MVFFGVLGGDIAVVILKAHAVGRRYVDTEQDNALPQ